jgi:hypothetical protein
MGFWFGLLLFLFLITALLVWFQVAFFSPDVWLILLSSLAFGLFAFRLLSAYVFVMVTADYFVKNGDIKNRAELSERSGKDIKELEDMPLSAVLTLILGALSPYRYAYYLAFTVILLFALAFGFLSGFNDVKIYTEALFWGAAITTFIVWAFDNFAATAVEQLAELEMSAEGESDDKVSENGDG